MTMGFKRKRNNSVLALSFHGNRLEGFVVRRTNGSVEITGGLTADLNLGLLGAETELAAQEIREQLDRAEIRERHCVVCLPLSWATTLAVKVPELPPADVQSFLQIEAERGFTTAPESLTLATFQHVLGAGDIHAALVGIPNEHLAKLEALLRASRLIPVGFSLGLPMLEASAGEATEGIVALEVGPSTLGLQINGRQGLVALRTLDSVMQDGDGRKQLNVAALHRELRITLGQLHSEVRASLRKLRVYDPGNHLDSVLSELSSKAASLGLSFEKATRIPRSFPVKLPPNAPAHAAVALAACYLSGESMHPDFLPPKVGAWSRFTSKYSAKKLVYGAAVIVIAALVVLGMFTVQQAKLARLRDQWASMDRKVRELEDLQQGIKKFRPWFDESFRSLSILKRLTEAFPEESSVTAKTLEIRDGSQITCTGTARDRQALYKTLDHLRSAPQVSEIKVDQERGAAPVQFSFNFQWGDKTQP